MKTSSLFLLAACILFHSIQVEAQTPVNRVWTSFNQKIDAQPYRGMNFELQCEVKSELAADSAGIARMWARVDVTKGRGFFNNMAHEGIVPENKWKTLTIKGRIDTNAVTFLMGGLIYYNGNFYYDNFRLKIETPGGWKEIKLSNSNFEEPSLMAWSSGYGFGPENIFGFSMNIEKEADRKNRVLKVTGNGVAAFGLNKSTGRYFSTNGVTLYYETYGTGEPLLLLHGNGQSIVAFKEQIPFFEKEYRVIIPDCRGRGKSTNSDAELTYHIQASDMNNLLNHLNIDSANIIGWSDGGIIGLIMAKDYPKKVKKLIASGANTLQDTTAFFPGDSVKFRKIINDTSRTLIIRKLYKLMLEHPNIPLQALSVIQCPVLVVAGDKDEIRIGHTVKIFESIPKGQLFIVPKTSHYVLSENPKVFNEAALKFLKESP